MASSQLPNACMQKAARKRSMLGVKEKGETIPTDKTPRTSYPPLPRLAA
ncbi:MAG: hypothetical protein ACK583_12105 [Cyanobacteriota bacterium]